MMLAAKNGHLDVVIFLVDKGSDLQRLNYVSLPFFVIDMCSKSQFILTDDLPCDILLASVGSIWSVVAERLLRGE